MPYLSTDVAAEVARRNAEHDEEFYLLVTADDVLDLAAGCVPLRVQAMARTLAEWEDMLRRNAARPVRPVARPPRRRRKGSR